MEIFQQTCMGDWGEVKNFKQFFWKMEEDFNFFLKNYQPQTTTKKTTSKKNGRRPQKKGRQPQKQNKQK